MINPIQLLSQLPPPSQTTSTTPAATAAPATTTSSPAQPFQQVLNNTASASPLTGLFGSQAPAPTPVVTKPGASSSSPLQALLSAAPHSAASPVMSMFDMLAKARTDGAATLFESEVHTSYASGGSNQNNVTQYATSDAATALAQQLGGQVTGDSLGGGFQSSVPMRMITVPGGANPINAGLALDLLNKYGTQPGSEAWRVIDGDLGIKT